jgi:tRNA dimethylallyltransferase
MNSSPIFIAGPTAVGKSAIALELAERLNGEIISVDSMQVYRGLDIGTAKPSLAERKDIPHHLIDVAELDEAFDAAKFCSLAQKAVVKIQSRNRIPIFCGGTGLYFKAFWEGLGAAPPADSILRNELEKVPLADLLEEIKRTDPVTFGNIDRQNPRRVIRAVEVIRLTGKPFSEQRSHWSKSPSDTSLKMRCFGFSRTNSDLHSRINRRVDEMFANGLVAETERLLKQGLEKNQTAMQAIGYRQVVEYLRGERSLPETIELVKIRTRQFAKRQFTWFRRQMQLGWIQLERNSNAPDVAHEICEE